MLMQFGVTCPPAVLRPRNIRTVWMDFPADELL